MKTRQPPTVPLAPSPTPAAPEPPQKRTGARCPYCNTVGDSRVYYTYWARGEKVCHRGRICFACKRRFMSQETVFTPPD